MTGRGSLLIGTVLAFGASLALGQQPDLQAIAAGAAKNQAALKQYAWQSRVNVSVDGEQKKTTLYQVRYDADGKVEKIPMGGEAEEKKVRGPLRKKMAKKKKKEAAEFAEEVKQQLQAYMTADAFKKAFSSAFARDESGQLKLHAEDVVAQGDSVEFDLVAATKQLMTMHISTTVDGSPLDVEVTFQKLDDGTNYSARQVVNTVFEKKKLVIDTENFSYVKQ